MRSATSNGKDWSMPEWCSRTDLANLWSSRATRLLCLSLAERRGSIPFIPRSGPRSDPSLLPPLGRRPRTRDALSSTGINAPRSPASTQRATSPKGSIRSAMRWGRLASQRLRSATIWQRLRRSCGDAAGRIGLLGCEGSARLRASDHGHVLRVAVWPASTAVRDVRPRAEDRSTRVHHLPLAHGRSTLRIDGTTPRCAFNLPAL